MEKNLYKKMKIDRKDILILKMLQENADISNKEIANAVDLTLTPVFERIKKLTALGLLRKKVYLLNRGKLGLDLIVLVSIRLDQHSKKKVNDFMLKMKTCDEVVECFHISGSFDFHLKIYVRDIEQYQDFLLNKLSAVNNIGHIESSFVMKAIKNTTALPID